MATIALEGTPFYYEERGSGPPLLLVAGSGGHAGAFSGVAPRLAERHRVITYDRRGHSRTPSAAPRRGYLRRHSDDAAALLRALTATPAAVAGWSYGAIVALAMAIDHPSAVQRIVLFEPPLHFKRHLTIAMARALGGAILLGKLGLHRRGAIRFGRWALRRQDNTTAFDDLPPAMLESLLANARAIIRELGAGTGEELTIDALRGIRCPVGIIVGGRSQPLYDQAASRLAAAIPTAQLVRVPEGDHAMSILRPALLAEAIERCLR